MFRFESWAAAALLVGFTFTVAACGGDDDEKAPGLAEQKPAAAESKAQPPSAVEPDTEDEIRYTGETESGDTFKAQFGGDVSLPSEFGSDMPAYPGSVIHSAMETTSGTAIVALESDASAEEIIDFYRDQLSGNGWSIESVNNVGRGVYLDATKGKRRVVVNAETLDRGTRLTLSIGPKPPN